MNRFEIFDGNMPRFEKALKKIENKCRKYNTPFHYEKVGEEYVKDTITKLDDGTPLDHPVEIVRRFIVVEVEAKPIIANWELVAVLEHTPKDGNIIHHINGDVEIPTRYYDAKPYCEHCRTKRYRKDTYIIRNAQTDDFKQVGKTCLRDFTGNIDAEWLANFYSMFGKLAIFEAPPDGSGWGEREYSVKDILAYTAAVTKIYGYIKGGATGERVKDFYQIDKRGGYGLSAIDDNIKRQMEEVNFSVTDDDERIAEEIIAYVDGMEETNNYVHNIKTLCKMQYVKIGNVNTLASSIVCYNRELERKIKIEKKRKEGSKSNFVGQVKNRITVNVDRWKVLTSWESCYGYNNYVTTYLYQFVDTDDNIFTWKTQKYFEDGIEIKTLVGTVKKHTDYHGTKQTELTRCKIMEVK